MNLPPSPDPEVPPGLRAPLLGIIIQHVFVDTTVRVLFSGLYFNITELITMA